MNYKLEQVLPGQVRLLFALDKEDTFEKHKIGHVRGDFGRSGDQFFSTWFPCHRQYGGIGVYQAVSKRCSYAGDSE